MWCTPRFRDYRGVMMNWMKSWCTRVVALNLDWISQRARERVLLLLHLRVLSRSRSVLRVRGGSSGSHWLRLIGERVRADSHTARIYSDWCASELCFASIFPSLSLNIYVGKICRNPKGRARCHFWIGKQRVHDMTISFTPISYFAHFI